MKRSQPVSVDGDECPFVSFAAVNVPSAEALWHFNNFDSLREKARFHFGDAEGQDMWMMLRMEDVRDACQTPDVFSNSSVNPMDADPSYKFIPEMLDAPLHTKWRHLLSPLFSPRAIANRQARVRQRFAEILDKVALQGECDYVKEVANLFPNTIFLEMLGLPVSDAAQFQLWEDEILHSGLVGSERSVAAMNEVMNYFSGLIAERRVRSRDDLVSLAIQFKIDGEPVSDGDLLAFCLLMFMAGLDTVAAQLGYSMMHLALHADDRRRLVREPDLIPGAVEEFLRYYAFVNTGRKVIKDIDFNGCPVRAGEMVYIQFAGPNRDPREFPDADKVIIDRSENRHIAFGVGPHRCLGSHLARLELRVGITEWLARIPEFVVPEGVSLREHGGQIGLEALPLQWTPPT